MLPLREAHPHDFYLAAPPQLLASEPTYGMFIDNMSMVADFEAFARMMRARGEDIDTCAFTDQIPAQDCSRLTYAFAVFWMASRTLGLKILLKKHSTHTRRILLKSLSLRCSYN